MARRFAFACAPEKPYAIKFISVLEACFLLFQWSRRPCLIALDVEFDNKRTPRVFAIANVRERTVFVACLTGEFQWTMWTREIQAAARKPGVFFTGIAISDDLKMFGIVEDRACYDLNQWFADALGYVPLCGSLGIGFILHQILQEDKQIVDRIKQKMRQPSIWHRDSTLTNKHIAYAALDVLVCVFLLQHQQPKTLVFILYKRPQQNDLNVPRSVVLHFRSNLEHFIHKAIHVLTNKNIKPPNNIQQLLLRYAFDAQVRTRAVFAFTGSGLIVNFLSRLFEGSRHTANFFFV